MDLGEVTGAVEAVTLRATRIRSVDGTVWHVSNGQIQRAGNMSQSLGPSGITIRLVAKTKPLEQWRITRLLRERIKAELDREGI